MVTGGFWEQMIPTSNTNTSGQDARKDAATFAYAIPLIGSAATAMLSIALRPLQPINWSSRILYGGFFGYFMFSCRDFYPSTWYITMGRLHAIGILVKFCVR